MPQWYTKGKPLNSFLGGLGFTSTYQGVNNFFDPLITDATANYQQALDYADNLSPQLGDLFYGTVARAERGGLQSKISQGRPQASAYFGQLARPGGFSEDYINQELANTFPASQGSFSGSYT